MGGYLLKGTGLLLLVAGIVLFIIAMIFYYVGWSQGQKTALWIVIIVVIAIIFLIVAALMIAVGCAVEYSQDKKQLMKVAAGRAMVLED